MIYLKSAGPHSSVLSGKGKRRGDNLKLENETQEVIIT